jgi:membrane-associated phospholipid phosphatase
LLVLQAAAVNGVINEVVKFTFARERPFVHALAEEDKPKQEHFSDNNLSFYSGHTSLTFSLAAASGTVASLRNYRLAPLVWATMMPVAALTGYLRIAGDRHYFTDVLAGAVMGTAAGVLVPLLFHGRSGPSDDRSSPSSSGASLAAATTPMAPVVPTVSFGGAF